MNVLKNNKGKVTPLPSMIHELLDKVHEGIEANDHSTALHHLREILRYMPIQYDIFELKLVCLFQLGKLEEAESLCEKSMALEDEHYFGYLHKYISILFHAEKYEQVLENIQSALGNKDLPQEMRMEYLQIYDMVKETTADEVEQKRAQLLKDYYNATTENNRIKQWQKIEALRKLEVGLPDKIVHSIKNKELDPVVKTAIFKWLIDRHTNDPVKIHKFGHEVEAVPAQFSRIKKHIIWEKVIAQLEELEHNNPSLFHMLAEELYRYFYVWFPILPAIDEVENIAEALLVIGSHSLQIETNDEPSEKVAKYIREITHFNKMYLEIIE